MSHGMTIDDLVRQVYYTQEKVILDFEYYDDKYREVIMELNLVLQELQKEEDWLWLRKRIELGPVDDFGRRDEIPEFELPEWVYKPSGLHDDGVRLHRVNHRGNLVEHDRIMVPWGHVGEMNDYQYVPYTIRGQVNAPDRTLYAVHIGDTVTFNRRLYPGESVRRIAVTDVQERIEQVPLPPRADRYQKTFQAASMSASTAEDKKAKREAQKQLDEWSTDYTEKLWFRRIPDPNYLVFRVAALHCVGSPVAQMRQQDLTDSAQKLLSAMREANAMATAPAVVDWDIPGYLGGC